MRPFLWSGHVSDPGLGSSGASLISTPGSGSGCDSCSGSESGSVGNFSCMLTLSCPSWPSGCGDLVRRVAVGWAEGWCGLPCLVLRRDFKCVVGCGSFSGAIPVLIWSLAPALLLAPALSLPPAGLRGVAPAVS